jgi:fluoride ion exporter CrcB/FEX
VLPRPERDSFDLYRTGDGPKATGATLCSLKVFAFQSVEMLEAGRIVPAVAYVAGTTAAALFAVWAGLRLFSA